MAGKRVDAELEADVAWERHFEGCENAHRLAEPVGDLRPQGELPQRPARAATGEDRD